LQPPRSSTAPHDLTAGLIHGRCPSDRTYSRDQASDLFRLTDNLDPNRSIAYGCDDTSRLRSATRQRSTIESWWHDVIGNRRYHGYIKDGVAQDVTVNSNANSRERPKLIEVTLNASQAEASDVTRVS
jgi:hypothetical protein